MLRLHILFVIAPLAVLGCGGGLFAQSAPSSSSRIALERAVARLAVEAPRWRAENGCYSCHNNADAVRALLAARRHGLTVDHDALSDTLGWLRQPAGWRHNGGDGEFNDRELAAIQFAFALLEATESPSGERSSEDRAALAAAADLVASFQRDDGAWMTNPGAGAGSPATYGPILATVAARQVLSGSEQGGLRPAVARASDWLAARQPRTVLDAAALLYGCEASAAPSQRKACFELIAQGRHDDGAWGPYVNSPPEAFDTALVLLALVRSGANDERAAEWIRGGRAWLVQTQFDDGTWRETTRPAGRESYAQRMSTTAWCVMALIATEPQQ